jgi:hypothetical protein
VCCQQVNGQDYRSVEAMLMIEVQMQCDDRARRIPSLLRGSVEVWAAVEDILIVLDQVRLSMISILDGISLKWF